jgi:hypothetical protein
VAAGGTVLGLVATAVFCLVYARLARRAAWPASAAAGLGAYAVCTLLLREVVLPVVPAFLLVCVALAAIAAVMPTAGAFSPAPAALPWDLPARMAIAATLVVVLTGVAHRLGPLLSGLLSPVPVFALVLAAFAHRSHGAGAAGRLLHGVVVGSVSFAAFFVVVGTALPRLGIAPTYVLAVVTTLAVNGALLAVVRRAA